VSLINHQARLAARPSGLPRASDWEFTTEDRSGRPRQGETVIVSGAAGAVGSIAGQLAAREHIMHGGVRDFPEVLLMLFDGANTGKMVLALDQD